MPIRYPLGRIPHFDTRSLRFLIKDLLTDEQINTYKSMLWACTIELNQGTVPSCTGHGHAHCLSTLPIVDSNVTEETALKIYSVAQTLDGIEGAHEGSTVLASTKAVQKLWPTAYGPYHWAMGIGDVLTTLSHYGPVILGIPWYEGMFAPDSNGVIAPTGENAGGHCLEAIGIDVPTRTVILHNSWGVNWGINGNCKINWLDLQQLLKQNGEAVVPTNRQKLNLAV